MVVANVVVVVAGVVAVVVVTGVVAVVVVAGVVAVVVVAAGAGSDQSQTWIQLRIAIFWI